MELAGGTAVLAGGLMYTPSPPAFGSGEAAPMEELVPISALMSSFSGRYQRQARAHMKIQISTATAVMRVNVSPAFTPKAL